jgi:hypothetical protein
LYPVSRLHLDAMTGDLGIWQHARGPKPDTRFGYCTDDVARAILVDALQSRELSPEGVEGSLRRSLRFVSDAFDTVSGRFLNLRQADGRWLEADASEDCHARTLLGLAEVMAEMPGTEAADQARALFERALPAAALFRAMRAISASLIACDTAIDSSRSADMTVFERLADRLASLFGDSAPAGMSGHKPSPASPDRWPWPRSVLTYENAIVPRALIVAGRRLGRTELVALGCSVLDWLIDIETGESGQFSPIGNSNWWHRGAERSRFDQQPIDAASMVAAAVSAFRATGRRRYIDAAEAAYGWFLGDNDLGVAMADPVMGACFDGLTPTGPNLNQGAESTLAWLAALEQIRELRRSAQRKRGLAIKSEPRSGLDS